MLFCKLVVAEKCSRETFYKIMNISLRQARAEDLTWLNGFYESLMRPYVELTHVWDDKKFRESFNPEITSIVQVDGEDIGMLKTEKRVDCIYLGDIQIKEAFQGRGIGTSLIKDVIENAKEIGVPVRLRVLKGNPVKKLYHSLGFVEIADLENCHELEWNIEQASGANTAPMCSSE